MRPGDSEGDFRPHHYKLILSEEVTDKNRGDNRRWHLPLPEPNPRATRAVLHYKHCAVPPPKADKKAPVIPEGELPLGWSTIAIVNCANATPVGGYTPGTNAASGSGTSEFLDHLKLSPTSGGA